MPSGFETSVFVNCPFDADYDGILQPILFCLILLGFAPRTARERTDSIENRMEKIRELIESSAFSIHDLSRSSANRKGEIYRLNMPFELGVDYACKLYFGRGRENKRLLVFEEKAHRSKAALSDLSGCDFEVHGGKFDVAVRKLRHWLVNECGAPNVAPAAILARYADFQGWYLAKQRAAGFSDEDIRDYNTKELMTAMVEWVSLGSPL